MHLSNQNDLFDNGIACLVENPARRADTRTVQVMIDKLKLKRSQCLTVEEHSALTKEITRLEQGKAEIFNNQQRLF